MAQANASGMVGFATASPVVGGQFAARSVQKSPCRVQQRRDSSVVATRARWTMQTWSDSAATREYFDFLSGKVVKEETTDGPSVIVGAGGRIGSLLIDAGSSWDIEDTIVRRGERIPADHPGPVYLCTRADALEEIIENCPENKKEDLVFLQNGMLEPLLRRHGIQDNTKVNLYCAVPSLGAKPIDGVIPAYPEGLTAATGKWSGAVKQRLEKKDLTCRELMERDFRRNALEKLIWISAFNLVGAVHGGIPMGQVVDKHQGEIRELIQELGTMVRFTLAVGMQSNVPERLCEYARTVKDFPTALKEFEWRNGWFYEYSRMALSKDLPDPTPMHTGYLEDGKEMGLISW